MRSFMRVWTKNTNCWEILKFFDENSLEKLNFYFSFFLFIFFEKVLLKIELSEITPFFYNNFFGFGRGWGFPPFPPGYALVSERDFPRKSKRYISYISKISISPMNFFKNYVFYCSNGTTICIKLISLSRDEFAPLKKICILGLTLQR